MEEVLEKEKNKRKFGFRSTLIIICVVIIVIASMLSGALADRIFGIKPLDLFISRVSNVSGGSLEQKVVKEESVVIDVVERVSPSVVTVSIQTPKKRSLEFVR